MKAILKIQYKFPSLNQYTGANRKDRYAGAKMKKELTDIVAWECVHQKIGKFKRIKLNFVWHEKTRKRDKDNICFSKKFILDGMIKSGVIQNDGWKEIAGFTDNFVISEWQGVEVEIIEVEGE